MKRHFFLFFALLFLLGGAFRPTIVSAQSLFATEAQTCANHSFSSGVRGLADRGSCFATTTDANNNANGVQCSLAGKACCSTGTLASCIDLDPQFTSAPPSSTSTASGSTRGATVTCKSDEEYSTAAGGCVKKSKPLTFKPNVPIPNLFDKAANVDGSLFARYVGGFFVFFLGIVGILSVVMIMWGGYHYIVSAGDSQRMKQGKETINNSIIGLVLAFTSYLLLSLINPALVSFNGLLPNIVQRQAVNQSNQTATLNSCQEAANELLNSPRVSFPYKSSCDDAQPATQPKFELIQVATTSTCTMEALTSNNCNNRHTVPIDLKILQGLKELNGMQCNFGITVIGGGIHSPTSLHYTGKAIDIAKPSNCSLDKITDAFCTKSGAHVCDEDSSHYHITSIADCPSTGRQVC